MHHGHPSRLGPLVDTKGNMLYHCGDGEIRFESRSYMDEVHVERRLAAILVADIAGYSRLMAEDEDATVATLKGHQAVVLPLVEAHGGRIQDTAGDGILAEFRSVQQAVECAIAIQRTMAERNAAVPPSRQMRFRIGVNLGDVMYDGTRAYGDGLNVAARIQALAESRVGSASRRWSVRR
jgi:class 3 adenylate cyclase